MEVASAWTNCGRCRFTGGGSLLTPSPQAAATRGMLLKTNRNRSVLVPSRFYVLCDIFPEIM